MDGISWTGRTNLVIVRGNFTANLYIGEFFRPFVIPFSAADAQNFTAKHDDALAHRAHNIVDFFFKANNIQTHRPWPANSLDLNVIEPLWDLTLLKITKMKVCIE